METVMNKDMRISEKDVEFLTEFVKKYSIKSVLEFGTGAFRRWFANLIVIKVDTFIFKEE